MAGSTSTVTAAPLAPQLAVSISNDEIFPGRALMVQLRVNMPVGSEAASQSLLGAPFSCALQLAGRHELVECSTQSTAEAVVSAPGAGILQLLDGRARFTLKLKPSFLERAKDETQAVLVVRLLEASPVLGALPSTTNDTPLLEGKSAVLKVCNKCLAINCAESKIPSKWYKDEGGQSNCLQVEISLNDAVGRRITDADRQVNVSLKLMYEDGTEVSSQSILAVAKDTYALTDAGFVKILARVMEVSQRHQGKKFMIKAFTSNPGVAAGYTTPVCVLSKRKRHQRKKEENEKRVKDFQRNLQAPPANNQSFNRAAAPPSMPAMGAAASPAAQPGANRAHATPASGVPGGSLADFVGRDGVRDAMGVMCTWVAAAVETLKKVEWLLVSFEQNVRTGAIDHNLPICRCPGCDSYTTVVTAKNHRPECTLQRALRQYQTEVQPFFHTMVDSLDLSDATRAAIKGTGVKQNGASESMNGYGPSGDNDPPPTMFPTMSSIASLSNASMGNMNGLSLGNSMSMSSSMGPLNGLNQRGSVSPRTLSAAAELISNRNTSQGNGNGGQSYPPAMALAPAHSHDHAPPYQLSLAGRMSSTGMGGNPHLHSMPAAQLAAGMSQGGGGHSKAQLDRQDSLSWLNQGYSSVNPSMDFGGGGDHGAGGPKPPNFPLSGVGGGLAPPSLSRGLTDALMSANVIVGAHAGPESIAFILRQDVGNQGLPAYDGQRRCLGFYKEGDAGNELVIAFQDGDPSMRRKAEAVFESNARLIEARDGAPLRRFAEETYRQYWSETGTSAALSKPTW